MVRKYTRKKNIVTTSSSATANNAQSVVAHNLLIEDDEIKEVANKTEISNYDKTLLGRAITQWQFGNWDKLISLKKTDIIKHPSREKLALIVATAHFQLCNIDAGRKFIATAATWGCDKNLILQILVSGVHNSLGVFANELGDESVAIEHFQKSIKIGAPHVDVNLISNVRLTLQSKK
jgi:hypothetical protein